MELTIIIPNEHIDAFLAQEGWIEGEGDPKDKMSFMAAKEKHSRSVNDKALGRQNVPDVEEPEPFHAKTKEEMVGREILHHFASKAYSRIRMREGGIAAKQKLEEESFAVVKKKHDWRNPSTK